MNPVYSMTGFASLSAVAAAGRTLTLQMKSVNHRHLDLQFRLPAGLETLEPEIRRLLKTFARRGHVEFTCFLDKETSPVALHWNEPLAIAHVAAFRRAAERLGLNQEPDLNDILKLPGVMSGAAPVLDVAEFASAVFAAVNQLVDQWNATRAQEGATLAEELHAGINRLEALTSEARRLRVGVAQAELTRLKARLKALLEGESVPEERMLAEAALLASRSDVEEELVRLKTHTERFLATLSAGGEVGRPLDFLLQELNREANTLLSKTGASSGDHGLQLTQVGLLMKAELERAREQVQNLE